MVYLSQIYGESMVNVSWTCPRCQQLKNYIYEKYENWAEMGPYGLVWAHNKTGRSPTAQDHFKTPPDPNWGYRTPQKNLKKSESPCQTSQVTMSQMQNIVNTMIAQHLLRRWLKS